MDVSVIIPCYNSGKYLGDALQSVAASQNPSGYTYEVIIVDDGSKCPETLEMLAGLNPTLYTVVHQENKGPGGARNTGVKIARGKYILFLDSDNKIRDKFIPIGIKLLETTDDDIVYGKPAFFGATTVPRFKTGEFNMESMLVTNHIDMCSMIRKTSFDAIGGFDEDRNLIAFEDWDLWIRAGAAGYKFHFVNEVLFDYRITNNSLLDEKNDEANHQKVVGILYQKYRDLILATYRKIGVAYSVYHKDRERPIRTFLKNMYYKYFYDMMHGYTLSKKH